MPELLTLGDYNPEERTGPTIWMRCIVDGALELPASSPQPSPPGEEREKKRPIPVLYLPGVSRQLLRSPEECPDELKPLVELQYRGVVWTQLNGKDWTVEAFLMSENGGLGLELGRDQKTRSALLGALDALATTPISTLRGHKLEAEDFDRLMVGDTVRDLLAWISDAAGTRGGWDAAHWSAFCSRCRDDFGLDPVAEGDLVRKYSRQYPVPTYVVEFLLGRYCATTEEKEIEEGLQIVERQLKDRTVRTGEDELFKARAREKGSVKLIDIIKARLDAKNDCFLAELPSLALKDVRIEDKLVHDNERMLTDGFYAEVTLTYDAAIAEEKSGRPFAIESLRPIQLSKPDVLETLEGGRRKFSLMEWMDFLLRSVGLEPASLSERAKWVGCYG